MWSEISSMKSFSLNGNDMAGGVFEENNHVYVLQQ